MSGSGVGLGRLFGETAERVANRVGEAVRDVLVEWNPVTSLPSELVIIQREDFTTGDAFVFQEPGTKMPIGGPATVRSAVIVADSSDFDITFTVDGMKVLDNDFSTLEGRSGELEHVSAYSRSSDSASVITVKDYDYLHTAEIVIEPGADITFHLQRAELDLLREP